MNSTYEHSINKSLRGIFMVFILLFAPVYSLISQDIHFTLFNNAPLFLNPANTGNFDGNWRITGNYRDQWRAISEPFTTASVSFDQHFYLHNQKIDGGAFIISDNSGAIGLSANKFYLSAAVEKAVGKNIFRFGIQAGYVFLAYGHGKYSYPSDWDMSEGIFALGNYPAEKTSYLDLNIGALWRTSINIFEPEVGVSLAHINSPNESFFDAEERLPIRYNIHAKLKTKLSDKMYLLPAVVYITRKEASEMVAGTNIGFSPFGKRTSVKEFVTGLYFRDGLFKNSDALSILGGVTIGRIDIAICYDYNISGLKVATGNKGGFEVSFAYRSISTVLNSYSIPCERF